VKDMDTTKSQLTNIIEDAIKCRLTGFVQINFRFGGVANVIKQESIKLESDKEEKK
jgi:hypothetical protein